MRRGSISLTVVARGFRGDSRTASRRLTVAARGDPDFGGARSPRIGTSVDAVRKSQRRPGSPSLSGMSAAPSLTLVVDLDAARPELEDAIVRAELLNEEHRYEEALAALDAIAPIPSRLHDLTLRALFAESWARMYLGELNRAEALLERAR